jgi:hypothetical protein
LRHPVAIASCTAREQQYLPGVPISSAVTFRSPRRGDRRCIDFAVYKAAGDPLLLPPKLSGTPVRSFASLDDEFLEWRQFDPDGIAGDVLSPTDDRFT